jgi:hypothetical protein
MNHVDGGVVGGVLPTARPFFLLTSARFDEDGGISCEGVPWAKAIGARQTIEIFKETRQAWVGVVGK